MSESTAPQSFADRMRALANEAAAESQKTGGGKNYFRLEKGRQKYRILMDFKNTLIYLGFRAHSGVSEEGKYQQAIDLNWLRSQPQILATLVANERLTEEQAAEIVEKGDPASRLFDHLSDVMGLKWQAIREMSKDNSPTSSPRAVWNLLDAESRLAGLMETSAGRGSMVAWFKGEAKLNPDGVEGLLGHRGYVQITGTGDKFDRAYNYAFIEDAYDLEADTTTYDLVDHIGFRILSPSEKAEFVRRSYRTHLLAAGLTVEELIGEEAPSEDDE